MVRETRHLWIGNLPENVREEQIIELFQRHGRVQSVKLLSEDVPSPHSNSNGGIGLKSSLVNGGQRATVSFIDIRSASKALRAGPTLSGQSLQIGYHEPGSVPPVQSVLSVLSDSLSSPNRDAVVTVNSESNSNPPLLPLLSASQSSPTTPSTNGPPTNNSTYRQQRFPIQHGQSDDGSSHFYDQPKGFRSGGRDDHFHGGRGRRENKYVNNRQFKNDRDRRFRGNWYSNENRFGSGSHCEGAENERMNSSIPPVVVTNNNNEPGTNNKSTRIPPDSPINNVRHIPSKIHQSRSVSESCSSDGGSSIGSRSRSGSRSSVSTSPSSGRSRSPPQPHHGSSGPGTVNAGPGGSGGGGCSGPRFHQNSFSSHHHHHRYNRCSRLVSRPADSSRIRHSHTSRSPPITTIGGRSRSSSSSSPSPHRMVSTAPHSRSRSPSSTKSYSPSRSLNSCSSHHHQKTFRGPSSSETVSSIRIRNLPSRSSDTSLKDGLYHEYKKHGKVSWVRISGNGSDRYGIVCFKSVEHASRAVALSQDKLFFGCKIQVSPYLPYQCEEGLGGTEEDNRSFGDDEFATTTPSRTVFVTGLDPSITAPELRKTFEQYGDIVDAKVRKPLLDLGTSCSGVIEFVDIGSANRAQWVRHGFKTREARISFYRNSVSSSILLDGIGGVSEKQISGHCCQFGAISRIVIDPDRLLALVQFEEISSAQTAFRELKNWIHKGRQLHVDYASPGCIRLFLDRAMLGSSANTIRLSPDLRNDTPNPHNTNTPTKGRRSGSRKFSDMPNDRRPPYRNTEGILDDKTLSDHSPERNHNPDPSRLEGYNGRRAGRYNVPGEEAEVEEVEERSRPKPSLNSSKIDLSCHEMDSAVVTSSSDIICVESDSLEIDRDPVIYDDHPRNHVTAAMVTVNGDEHGSSYESVGVLKSRGYRWSSKSQSVFDGVSSTSPEPKTETVHEKVSPDSGTSGTVVTLQPFPPMDPQPSPGNVLDPRRSKASENKIRRSSADSGNLGSAFAVVNSNAGTTSSMAVLTNKETSDDRPSTPPSTSDENRKMDGVMESPSQYPATWDSLEGQSATSPPPKPLERLEMEKSLEVESSPTTEPPLPVTPPPQSVMPLTPEQDSIPLLNPLEHSLPRFSPPAKSTNGDKSSSVTELSLPPQPEIKPIRNPITDNGSTVLDQKKSEIGKVTTDEREHDDDGLVSPPSSDCDDSPRGEEDLTQRLQELYQKFDAWDSGSRSIARFSTTDETADTQATTRLSLHLDKPWLSRSKAIDLDELRSQPSDITKSLIGKRSVFDDDSQRLEGLNDMNLNSSSLPDWRMSLIARTNSTTSISSSPSVPLTPSSATSTGSSTVFPLTPTIPPDMTSGLSSKPEICTLTKPLPSSLPVKIPATAIVRMSTTDHVPIAGPLPNSVIKRKESVTPWVSKDPRLSKSTNSYSSKIPIAIPTVLTLTAQPITLPPPVQRSASLNPVLTPKLEGRPSTLEGIKVDKPPPSDEPMKPLLTTQKSAPPLGIHQGIPRMVERSLSLDSKKQLVPPIDPLPVTNPCNSIPANTASSSTTPVFRKLCLDTYPPSKDKESSLQRKEEKPKVKEGTYVPKPVPVATIIPSCKSLKEREEGTREGSPTQHPLLTPVSVSSSSHISKGGSGGKLKEKKDKDSKKSVRSGSVSSKSKEDSKSKVKEKTKDKNGESVKHEHGHHHHKKDKESTSSVKEKSNEIPYTPTTPSIPLSIPPSSSSSSSTLEPKREKELKKRRMSVSDLEPESKKPKVEEKESEPSHLHHGRTKSSSSVERRESSSSSKEVKKERTHSCSVKSDRTDPTPTSSSSSSSCKDKSGKSHKDSHHRSKSTSSTSLPPSKPHYHSGTCSTSKPSEKPTLSLHSNQVRGKEKKEKVSRGESGKEKENKPKHSTSHGSSHRKSDKEEKLPTGLSSKDKSRGKLTSEDDEGPKGLYRTDKSKSSISSNKSEKKDSSSGSGKVRRDRQKSGGDSSPPGENILGKEGSGKMKEQKKRRSRVVEETDSSSEDERERHHSIFDVVVDEYVSMYDKVKARSNRACKNVPRKQEEEIQKRQDKIQDSLQLLKRSRAKRDEKKRFSIDDHRSAQNSSDDEVDSRHDRDSSHDFEVDRRLSSVHSPRTSLGLLCTSSEDDEKQKVSKTKSKSSRDGSIKSEKSKSSRKSSKASPLRSSAYFLNHSDEDSLGLNVKKAKMSVKQKSSDEDSMSEPIREVKRPLIKKSSFANTRKSLTDIYTESDNSTGFKDRKGSSSGTKMRKDKRQKSMRHIFETSDSSGDEKGGTVVHKKLEKEVKTSTKEGKVKKKGSHHSNSTGSKRKRERMNSENKNVESKKPQQQSMEDLLFGPMSNSGSEFDEPKVLHPPPTIEDPLETFPKGKQASEDSPKKVKSQRSKSKQRRSSSFKSTKFLEDPSGSVPLPQNLRQQHPEKRKKKHKKSKRAECRESSATFHQQLDIDSLFSTPISSPAPKENKVIDEPKTLTLFAAPEVKGQSPEHGSEEKVSRSMFSSDEDDDDKLKIDISEAIISASGNDDEEDGPREMGIDEAAAAAASLLEEEEKKRNSLVEQDKAIESILMERKSPHRPPLPTHQVLDPLQPHQSEPDYLKDELKDETSISQEETEDAVAALLKNLGNDDEMEDEGIEKSVRSPPTIRIIEEPTSITSAETEIVAGRSSWFQGLTKSPKPTEDSQSPEDSCQSPPRKKKLTCEEASIQLHEVLEMAKQAVAEQKKLEEATSAAAVAVAIPIATPPIEPSVALEPLSQGNDVYEFHDSDDDTARHTLVPPPPPPPSMSPVISPPVAFPKPESKATTPPRTKSPASSGLLELVIEKLPLVTPQFSPKSRPFPGLPTPAPLPQQLKPITIDVPPIVEPIGVRTPKQLESPRAAVVPIHLVPTMSPVSVTNRTPPTGTSRNNVDETIEDVIKNFKCAEIPSPPLPLATPVSTPGRKGKRRSGSKDLDEMASIASAAAKSRQASPTRRISTSQKQKIETRTDSHPGPIPEPFLIDPQTGHLTHKVQGEDSAPTQYIPVSSQLPFHHLPPRPGGQRTELERAGSLERIGQDQHQAYQIQIQKNEGLPAILAQTQQQQQQHQQGTDPSSSTIRKDSFGPAPPPTSSPSFTFSPMRVPTPQSPPIRYGMYPIPTSSQHIPGYTPLMRPQQDLRPPIRHQLPVGQHIPSPGQIQAQLVRIPQVPMATTITKVDGRMEENGHGRKGSQQQQQQPPSTVILTTTSSNNGPIEIMSGIRQHPTPHHHLPLPLPRPPHPHESYSGQGPPRIDISGGMVPVTAHSPKGSRMSMSEPSHRMHIAYESPMMDDMSPSSAPLDLAPPSAHAHSCSNNNNPVAKNLAKTNSNSVSVSPSPPPHQHGRQTESRVLSRPGVIEGQFLNTSGHQGGYLPYVPSVTNLPPNQHGGGFGIRPGSVDSMKQADGTKQLERPSTAHLVPLPQHLSSPHLGERGSAESPHLVPMYSSRHTIYGNGHLNLSQPTQHHSPIPSAHQHSRQMFTHPLEFDESRMYARSPGGYPILHHENREGVPPSRGEEGFVRRPDETPPPAHGMMRYTTMVPENQRLIEPTSHQILPTQGDSLLHLLQRYPIVWQGMLALKNDSAQCQFHFISGNMNVATDSLPTNPDGSTLPLRISQRMRLETVQLDGVARKLQTDQEHCMLLALPTGHDHLTVLQHSNNLRSGFITYLQLKQAAGIVNVHQSNGDTPSFVIHIFPACDFANENLARIAPDLLHGVTDIAHLLIVIATV